MEEKVSTQKIETEELSRGLENRHMQMIAIGGAIGVGLFYGSTYAVQEAGPSVLLAFGVVGIALLFVMRALGELAVEEPVSGSFSSYATRYIKPFAGYYLAWTFVLSTFACAAAEYNAIGAYLQYWISDFPIWATGVIILCILTFVNVVGVKYYGEVEFWLCSFKVVAIIGMIIIGGCMILFGWGNGGEPIGLSRLVSNGGFFPKGISGFLLSFILVQFSFGGMENIGVSAGEAADLKRTIPKAIKSVFWRILIFYVGAIFVMLCLENWSEIGTTGSPFVTVFAKVGIPAAASILNFVVITAGISNMNSAMYTSTRLMYNLSRQGQAHEALSKVNRNNIPYVAFIATIVAQALGIIANFLIPASTFAIFSSIAVVGSIGNWLGILFSELKFRKMKIQNGEEETISFKMPLWPYSSYFSIALILFILVIMWFMPFSRVALYVCPVWMALLYIIYRLSNKKKLKGAEAARQ